MADYYIDGVSGNDTTGDGSVGNPWQTLNKCNVPASNSTVYITPGVYTYPTSTPNANLHYICTEENTENKVIIDQDATKTDFLNNPNELNGFYLRNTGAAGVSTVQMGNYETSRSVSNYGQTVFKNCIIGGWNETAAGANRVGIRIQGVVGKTSVRFENCILFSNYTNIEEYSLTKRMTGWYFINCTFVNIDRNGGAVYVLGIFTGGQDATIIEHKNCFYAIYDNTLDTPDALWYRFQTDAAVTVWNSDYNLWYGRARVAGSYNVDTTAYNNLTAIQTLTAAPLLTITARDLNSQAIAVGGTADAAYWAADPIGKASLNVATDIHLQFDQSDPASIIDFFTPSSLESPLFERGDGVYSDHVGFVGPNFPRHTTVFSAISPMINPRMFIKYPYRPF